MKKTILTIALVLGIAITTFADPNGGGLFHRGADMETEGDRTNTTPLLPIHNQQTNQDATPIGSGIAVLTVLGAAYLIGKRMREDGNEE